MKTGVKYEISIRRNSDGSDDRLCVGKLTARSGRSPIDACNDIKTSTAPRQLGGYLCWLEW
jgi:hypothetical protein